MRVAKPLALTNAPRHQKEGMEMGMDGGCGRSEDVTCHFAHLGKVKGGDSGMVMVCDPIPHYMVAVDRERFQFLDALYRIPIVLRSSCTDPSNFDSFASRAQSYTEDCGEPNAVNLMFVWAFPTDSLPGFNTPISFNLVLGEFSDG